MPENRFRFVTATAEVPGVRMGAMDYLVLVEWCLIAISLGVEWVRIPYLIPRRNIIIENLLTDALG